MKKYIMILLIIMTVLSGIVACLIMMTFNRKLRINDDFENVKISEKIIDECTDEYEELQNTEILNVNSENEEKLSPNAILTFEKYYTKCNHSVFRYEEVPSNLVNATREEVEKKYNSWKLIDFSKDKVVLKQEVEDNCDEHYMLRDVDGKINIYKLDEEGNETILRTTEISTEYLAEKDKIDMKNGLIVYGKESLNRLLEDYE